jgi:putative nucleotidyltransferase with HDIG domain
MFLSFAEIVMDSFDEKHPFIRGHSLKVTHYAEKIAVGMGFDKEEQKKLSLSSLLHDIGRIGIEDGLLDKTRKLSVHEFERIKKHAQYGAMMLSKIDQMHDIVPWIMHHHERIDGNGYPGGLSGDSIPLCARVLHVADSFDAMTSVRPYRIECGKDYAFSELIRYQGIQFDTHVVEVALRVL